jgi:hypothetical protein
MEERRKHWTFLSYLDELTYMDEISEIPGVDEYRNIMIDEVWERFPKECIEFHLVERKAA